MNSCSNFNHRQEKKRKKDFSKIFLWRWCHRKMILASLLIIFLEQHATPPAVFFFFTFKWNFFFLLIHITFKSNNFVSFTYSVHKSLQPCLRAYISYDQNIRRSGLEQNGRLGAKRVDSWSLIGELNDLTHWYPISTDAAWVPEPIPFRVLWIFASASNWSSASVCSVIAAICLLFHCVLHRSAPLPLRTTEVIMDRTWKHQNSLVPGEN